MPARQPVRSVPIANSVRIGVLAFLTLIMGPPAHGDYWEPERPRYVFVGDRLLDLDRRRLVDSAELGPSEARATDSDDLLRRGVHAVRGDGAKLRSPAVATGNGRRELTMGPLRSDEARKTPPEWNVS